MNNRLTKWLAEAKKDSLFVADTRHHKPCSDLFSRLLKDSILLSAIRAKKKYEYEGYTIEEVDTSGDKQENTAMSSD